MKKNKKLLAVAMSGGVDSTVVAWLLKKLGYSVIGFFMINWENNDNFDIKNIIKLSFLLNIEIKLIKFKKIYKKKVIKKFFYKRKKNLVINPDLICNKIIKFGILLKYLKKLKIKKIATGHYAKIKKKNNNYFLKISKDFKKDQTYFLSLLKKKQIKKILFPLGNLIKNDIRNLLKKFNLINKNKKDSYGICFIKNYSFIYFLNNYIRKKIGYIFKNNKIIGLHIGCIFYTIGQKKKYIIEKKIFYINLINLKKNYIYITSNNNKNLLLFIGIIIKNFSWINKKPKDKNYFLIKIRHNQLYINSFIIYINKKKIFLKFIKLQISLAKGQSVTLYENKKCIGGGIINNIIKFI